MLIMDILSRFDGRPDTIYPVINHFGNFMIFLLNPIIPSLWLLYVVIHFHEDKKRGWLIYLLVAIFVLNAGMLLLSQFFGWFYYIDSENIYHRGPLFMLSTLITIALIFTSFVLIIMNRKKVEKQYYFSLLFFMIPPCISIVVQIIFYGISLILNSVVLSILIVYLYIQNQNIFIDYLTGAKNRRKLEIYLKEKINAPTKDETFSAIMIDLNNFKAINDTFGHDIGDKALQISVKLLSSCIRSNDFIARYGGDEFCVVLDISNRSDLEDMVCRINNCVDKYNKTSDQPYILDFSMGYAVYDYCSHMEMEEFQKKIDLLMYQNKKANKKMKRDYELKCFIERRSHYGHKNNNI